MKRNTSEKKYGRVIWKIGAGLIAMSIYIYLVNLIWNWIIPDVFGLPKIDFLQTFGLLILLKLLFLGSGWHQYKKHRRFGRDYGKKEELKHKFMSKWKNSDCFCYKKEEENKED